MLDLDEDAIRLIIEKRSKEQQLQGLMKTTGHVGFVGQDRNLNPSGHIEKDPTPRRSKPAPKKGYDPHPDNVKAHSNRAKQGSKELAGSARSPYSADKKAAGDGIRKLRGQRDRPSRTKDRKAEAGRRLPIKFPKDLKKESFRTMFQSLVEEVRFVVDAKVGDR